MPGATELVRRLQAAGVPLGLVTSALPEHVATRLLAADLLDVFDVVVWGGMWRSASLTRRVSGWPASGSGCGRRTASASRTRPRVLRR